MLVQCKTHDDKYIHVAESSLRIQCLAADLVNIFAAVSGTPVHKSPLNRILSQINPLHTVTLCILKMTARGTVVPALN
jgi:PIN domain nuclease of toxin-antitoxin system